VNGQRWRASRRQRSLLRALGCLFGAVTLFLGPLQSGARYFYCEYCESLGLLASDPCATGARKGADCSLQSLERTPVDCCTRITLPKTPDGARADEHVIAPARVIGVLLAADYCGAGAGVDPGRRFEVDLLRRPPRSRERWRAQLMVFLT